METIKESRARINERELIISILKRATNYKLMQRMPDGRYFETTVHDSDWDKFREHIEVERSLLSDQQK